MRRKLFENHIKKYLSNCFNNLTLESQDSTGIEEHSAAPLMSLVAPMHVDSSDGVLLGAGGELVLFVTTQIIN